MKRFSISFVGLMLMTVFAGAQEAAATSTPPASGCSGQAAEKKLAGAALNSFMKKCERDAANTSCDASAADKKGGFHRSFIRDLRAQFSGNCYFRPGQALKLAPELKAPPKSLYGFITFLRAVPPSKSQHKSLILLVGALGLEPRTR